MTTWEIFNAGFWITIATLVTGSLALVIKYSLKSKCDNVQCCWGAITIHRNVELENNEENSNTIETTPDNNL
jgi:hypothetical protein